MKLTALQLSQAGFDNDTIKSYVDMQVPLLEKGGFTKNEIYKSYGITETNSKAFSDNDMQEDTTAISEPHLPLGIPDFFVVEFDSRIEKSKNIIENKRNSLKVLKDKVLKTERKPTYNHKIVHT